MSQETKKKRNFQIFKFHLPTIVFQLFMIGTKVFNTLFSTTYTSVQFVLTNKGVTYTFECDFYSNIDSVYIFG